MKKLLITLLALASFTITNAQDVYVAKNAVISFFSKTPLEDIEATTKTAASAINVKTKAVYFKVDVKSFKFKKKLMQEHFNENYLETDKFPNAEFTGTLSQVIDMSKDGTYPVDVAGKLTIHGVTKDYKTKGTVIVKGGKMIAQSKFIVALKDHNIKIPTLLVKQIAENIELTITAAYEQKK